MCLHTQHLDLLKGLEEKHEHILVLTLSALVSDRARSAAGASVRGGCARRTLSADWCCAGPLQWLSQVAHDVLLRAPTDTLQLWLHGLHTRSLFC